MTYDARGARRVTEYATNSEGMHAVAEMRRRRKWQRDHGVCCSDGLCEACESEAEARKAEHQARDY